jgi:sec-independent protein translocase protein TatA
MGGIGPEKLILVLMIVLVLFGAKRIPEIGSSIGKGIREFKKGMNDLGGTISEPPPDERRPPETRSLSAMPPAPAAQDDARAPKRLLD